MQQPSGADEFSAFGLAGHYGAPLSMARYHRHHEVELNLVVCGTLTYLFGATAAPLPAGRLALFWGVLPHRVAYVEPGTLLHWLTIPLGQFLQWRLPPALTRQVLSGLPICDQDTSRAALDQALLEQWQRDLRAAAPERHAIVQLEIEARLRRLALGVGQLAAGRPAAGSEQKIEQIARLIAERYAEPLRVRDLAASVGLHPHYAMQLFRKTFGMSLLEYLAQHRIAHAQRLLITTDAPVAAIGLDCGFGSASQFYALFKRACGVAPGAYRAGLAAHG
ncbi:MAG: helix-turn-helix domain-containing protein [Kouleothrix sp.]|jgi:AraC-like DNA-binding protein|nr:helix-turn-helix domain-containing protein [Kouleothrix sp.]